MNFFNADRLAGKDRAEVNLFVPQTDAPDSTPSSGTWTTRALTLYHRGLCFIWEARDRATEKGDIPNRLRADEMLGKHLGMWKEPEKTVNVHVTAQLTERLEQAKLRCEEYDATKTLEGEFAAPTLQLTAAPDPPTIDQEAEVSEPARNMKDKYDELQSTLRCPVVPSREYDDWVADLERRNPF